MERRAGGVAAVVVGVDLERPRQVGGTAVELLVEPVAEPPDRLGKRQRRGRQREQLAGGNAALATGVDAERGAEGAAPLRLFTSRHDHVVEPADSEHLATVWGAAVEHTWLERSYHVATLDYDRDLIIDATLRFVAGFAAPARVP